MVDEKLREHWSSLGIAPKRVLSEGIEIINSVADAPGVHFAMHLCRGNYQSRWISAGGYESISKALFERATNFDAFLLEYDDPRSGSFEALDDLPNDKLAVLGLVSSKKNELESIDELVARIEEAARHHPRESLAVSTQCGFASVAMGNEVSERTQEQKLRLVAQTAARVWG
jgi:5-methyltetrahydropteroyltriglutamate--homocysteine methyltransferase